MTFQTVDEIFQLENQLRALKPLIYLWESFGTASDKKKLIQN